MYSSFGRTGGCASCGVAPRGISGDHYSNNYYSTFNRYEANNNYNDYYNLNNNRLNTSYSNGLRNIMIMIILIQKITIDLIILLKEI